MERLALGNLEAFPVPSKLNKASLSITLGGATFLKALMSGEALD